MKLRTHIDQQQSQVHVLSADLQQSLAILSMSQQELKDCIYEQVYSNPLLEFKDAHADDTVFLSDKKSGSNSDSAKPLTKQSLNIDDISSPKETFAEFLMFQLSSINMQPALLPICHYIIQCLDDRGYLDASLKTISHATAQPLINVLAALHIVQSLSPCGVAARSLKECLAIQLKHCSQWAELTKKLIENGLELLATNNVLGVADLLNTDMDSAKSVIRLIRSLNPIPASGFYTGEKTQYAIPDAAVHYDGREFTICLNDSFVPQVLLNTNYCDILSKSEDKKVSSYYKTNSKSAKNLINHINNRRITLYNVIYAIVTLQPEYFMFGTEVRPMSMDNVAKKLNLNVSTVSRAVHAKCVTCKAGIVYLKTLFSSGYTMPSGVSCSSITVKNQIKHIIAFEDTLNPLSDEAIKKRLESCGITVSRRTVAKYREQLGLLSSRLRKRY